MGDVVLVTETLIKIEEEIKKEPVERVEATNTLVQPEISTHGPLKEKQFDLEEDEIKPPLAVFLLPEQEIEAGSEEKDPLAQSNTGGNDAPVKEEELLSTDGSGDGAASDRRFACGYCGKRFGTRQHLTTHTYIHTGEKPFACATCGKRFREKQQVGPHERTHSGERPFACPTCSKRFVQRAHLALHVRTHTQEKPFACAVCGKLFIERSKMRQHMRVHTREQPYECDACGKRFSLRGSLVTHGRTHTGEKPFACETCGRRFALKQTLDGHVRTHFKDRDKANVCILCGKSFPHPRSLACHMRYTHWKETADMQRSSADTPRTT